MQVRGRRLRFTAVLAIVVLALTGFSRGHGHGHSHHSSGGGGGGCSSSHQDHDSSSSSTSGGGSYDDSSGDSDDDSYGSSTSGGTSGGSYNRPTHRPTSTPSGGSSGTTLTAGTAKLISCATEKRPYATVEITNPNNRKATFQAWVTFYDADGAFLVSDTSPEVSVPARGKATTRVPLDKSFVPAVDHCEADEEAQLRS
ncbi:hypothetical protein GCM10014715_32760 [Streptomyces spiralis]|uniref:Uncharacterized protein n=1 Tax=Streptomyces spiralis TaxID=66376 RepID=A0A918ZYT4_9ACTN|nr:hypothetical protein [Streptomyces spiralis]GHE75296.1 hypothetical protein GCM10014715_32760 [Streptomyces spiralis]